MAKSPMSSGRDEGGREWMGDPLGGLGMAKSAVAEGEARAMSVRIDEVLGNVLRQHLEAESGVIRRYEEMVESTKDPWVSLIVGLVLDDEKRHHVLLQQMVATVAESPYWQRVAGKLPDVPVLKGAERVAAEREISRLAEAEHQGSRDMHHVAQKSKDVYSGLVSALLEVMAKDSVKHEHLLRFLQRRLAKES